METDSVERMNVRLFFSEEELYDLAIAAGYENVIKLVNSNSLYVKIFEPGQDDCGHQVGVNLDYFEFTITEFDEENGVWSVEIPDMDDASVLLLSRGQTLPVDLISFTGDVLPVVNRLYWSTANESNNEGFQIEKSKNGIQFESIGFVKSSGEIDGDYVFDDIDPWTGSNYYRLKQIDFDGNSKYSHIIHLVRQSSFDFRIVENPFRQTLYIEIDSNTDIDANISIFAINGQIVYEQDHFIKSGSSELQFDLNSINSGNYIVRFFNKKDKTFLTKKIVKI